MRLAHNNWRSPCTHTGPSSDETLALSVDHPKKAELISWCKEYDASFTKHCADCNEVFDEIFAARASLGKYYAEEMTRMADRGTTTSEQEKFNNHVAVDKAYIQALEKKLKGLGIDGQHEKLRAEFAARPKME